MVIWNFLAQSKTLIFHTYHSQHYKWQSKGFPLTMYVMQQIIFLHEAIFGFKSNSRFNFYQEYSRIYNNLISRNVSCFWLDFNLLQNLFILEKLQKFWVYHKKYPVGYKWSWREDCILKKKITEIIDYD